MCIWFLVLLLVIIAGAASVLHIFVDDVCPVLLDGNAQSDGLGLIAVGPESRLAARTNEHVFTGQTAAPSSDRGRNSDRETQGARCAVTTCVTSRSVYSTHNIPLHIKLM